MNHTHWNILSSAANTATIDGVHPLVIQLLSNRGISDPSRINLFLHPDSSSEADPFLLPDMDRAIHRTKQAIFSFERIVIYGDFDADGITATALLVQGLSALGANVMPYIPHRLIDGYGLKASALDKLKEQGVSLIITVDNGITAIEEVDYANANGLDVIVTDHHIPLSTLPRACAVINPKRVDSQYPYIELAGVGVAFKFLKALLQDDRRIEILDKLFDLVAIGTITDMVPLTGENRYWVKRGLDLINATERIGLQEMMQCAGIKPGTIDAQTVSWAIGPRINAAGRIDNAATSYQLLLTKDRAEARSLAKGLEGKNAERLQMTNDLFKKAREKIVAEGIDHMLLMTGDADFPEGVTGLVAGKLVDEFYRPVILLTIGPESTRGSGRSIAEFDLMAALEQNHDLLSKFGGHKRAAGFSIPNANLEAFRERILKLAHEKLSHLHLQPHINIDAVVPLSVFCGDTFAKLQQLEPFGFGNPIPIFLSRHVQILEARPVGMQENHLKLRIKDNSIHWDVMGFGMADQLKAITSRLDMVYTIESEYWNGQERLRLKLVDFTPSR